MYELFGEFDCIEELNATAAGQREQGDKESLMALAKENGIDEFVTGMYMDGDISELADTFTGAIGKLTVEKGNIKSIMPVEPIVDYLSSLCMDEGIARLIRCKDKSLKACIDMVYKKCEEECKKSRGHVADQTVFDWAKEYYTEG